MEGLVGQHTPILFEDHDFAQFVQSAVARGYQASHTAKQSGEDKDYE
jgi:hypothetical protein